MSHFRTSQDPYRLVPQVRRIWVYKQVNRPSCMCRYLSRFVAVCVWKIVVCYFGHRRIHNFRLEFVFNRKKKTNRPIFWGQITSPGTHFMTGRSIVPWVLLSEARQGTLLLRYVRKDGWNLADDNNTRLCSRKMGWLVWFSRLKMSYRRKLGTFWYFFFEQEPFLLPYWCNFSIGS